MFKVLLLVLLLFVVVGIIILLDSIKDSFEYLLESTDESDRDSLVGCIIIQGAVVLIYIWVLFEGIKVLLG